MKRNSILIAAVCAMCSSRVVDAGDWPHWRGPQRDDRTTESSGWDGKTWPLRQVWRRNVGAGSASVVVANGKLYTMGWNAKRETVWCLDPATGRPFWSQSYSAPEYGRHSVGDKGIYSGVSSTPEFDTQTKLLYTLGIDGDLHCRDTKNGGRKVWGLNLYKNYGAGQRPDTGGKRGGRSRRDYGYTTSPLVSGESLIVEVGDTRQGNLMGFDKRTGRRLWASECKDEAGHSGGPVLMTVESIPCVVILTLRNLVVIRLDSGNEGRTLATHPWTTAFGNNIPTPAISGSSVIVTSAYNQYAMARLDVSRKGIKEVWRQRNPSGVCSPVVHKGKVYWAWRQVHCVDLKSGKELWRGGNVGSPGSCVITGDDRLVVLANRGELSLVETAQRSPKQFKQLAARRSLFRTDAWPHVVVANRRLYCKDRAGNLICFQLR